jgi:hypothetical protein
MIDIDKNLADVLGTEYIPAEETKFEEDKQLTIQPENKVEEDADFARNNLYGLIEKGNEALGGILEVAKHSQHPRAYEVAANMIKHLSDVTEKLMTIQKQQQDILNASNAQQFGGMVSIDKAVVFTGSTSELLKQIKAENANV